MPTWRADYFDNPRDNAPSRSEIIVAEKRIGRAPRSAQQDGCALFAGRGDSARSYRQSSEASRLRSVAYIAVCP
jgi:hypothetical protein